MMAGFNDAPLIRTLAVPSVIALISFLGYFSQLVFRHTTLDPGPPSRRETIVFNTLLALLWFTYYKTVVTDPGRYVFTEQVIDVDDGQKWCKKCETPKPPRAHHCRVCKRCVPKMDHHCPWTGNCISMTTFPHFIRFLVYANLSLWYLGHLLWQRFAALWESRHLPAYLGPSLPALSSLAVIGLVWSATTLALGIMLVTSGKACVLNRTSIEGWELEKHESLMERSKREWWDMKGADGKVIRIESTEFPYDVGFFANMAQAMGTKNPIWWFFPLAGNPTLSTDKHKERIGWTWPENGFNRTEGMWPPPDPEKIRQARREWPSGRRNFASELANLDNSESPEERIRNFKLRQEKDAKRRNMLMGELEEYGGDNYGESGEEEESENGFGQKWRNPEGETLHDFGVEEDAESTSNISQEDEDVPLGELLRRRKGVRADDES